MKWFQCVLTAAILSAVIGLPFREKKTQQLLPVRTLQVVRTDNGVRIVSEYGEGNGSGWTEAVENLRSVAAGEIFFDTAEQVIFSDSALAREAAASKLLRPSAQVHFAQTVGTREDLSDYLSAHPSGRTISDFE